MTIDKSLKVKAGSVKVRNVLTRVERIAKLKETEKFDDATSSVLGMPKVRVQKISLKKKKEKKKDEDEGGSKKKKK
ncbi:MAG TPA: small basic protein [Planctomycetaceae bacterium]|nr:small basic protein [Planctomycetaceae bacterium]HRF02449.1 small basic protein [Pirellulaceae bacterium]